MLKLDKAPGAGGFVFRGAEHLGTRFIVPNAAVGDRDTIELFATDQGAEHARVPFEALAAFVDAVRASR